jgi:glycosyltransferase involved in cell wall biosynthesis
LRIAFLSASGQLGGAERALLDMLASLRTAAPDWPLGLVCAADGPLVPRVSAIGVAVHVVPFPPSLARLGESGAADGGAARFAAQVGAAAGPVAGYVAALRQALLRFAPDLVHSHGLKMHLLGAFATDAPVIWHLHDFLGARGVSRRLLRWNVGRCAAVIANSDSVAADVRAALDDDRPVTRVYNAVDLQRFSPDGEVLDLDRLAGWPAPRPGVVRVGLLGTFARWKGHETFFRAISNASADVPLRAYVIGGPVYQTDRSQHTTEDLCRIADRLGIHDRVAFTGVVDRPDTALRALDIAVHASTSPEPFGLAIAEAMACGRALVASAGAGATELTTPGVDALVHTPGDASGLADAVRSLATDPSRRRTLGHAARATAVARFDRARLAHDLIPIYAAVSSRFPVANGARSSRL